MWWRLLAFGAIVGLLVQGYAEVKTAHRPTVEPYYVYVNQQGDVLGVERMSARPFDLHGAVLEALAAEWLNQVRSVPMDVDVMRENWKKALQISTDATAKHLLAYAKLIGLTELAKRAKEREVALKVIVKNVRSLTERVIRIEWQEVLYIGSTEQETSTYTGEIEFLVKKPTTQQEIDQNARGIWVGRFVWAKDQVRREDPT
jgi:type IV secretion system protein VirB5